MWVPISSIIQCLHLGSPITRYLYPLDACWRINYGYWGIKHLSWYLPTPSIVACGFLTHSNTYHRYPSLERGWNAPRVGSLGPLGSFEFLIFDEAIQSSDENPPSPPLPAFPYLTSYKESCFSSLFYPPKLLHLMYIRTSISSHSSKVSPIFIFSLPPSIHTRVYISDCPKKKKRKLFFFFVFFFQLTLVSTRNHFRWYSSIDLKIWA